MHKIIIEEDGWVHIQSDPAREGVFDEGLGDINVDVVIEDRRQLTYKMKEKNYLDVACTCGHIPQGEKHLCDLHTLPPKPCPTCGIDVHKYPHKNCMKIEHTLKDRIKIALGYLSPCCAAPTIPKEDGYLQLYCSQCKRRI